MSARRRTIAVMHGVNVDQLGRRDPALYGSLTLAELERQIEDDARRLDLDVSFFHSNHEGAFVEHLHGLAGAGGNFSGHADHGKADRAGSQRLGRKDLLGEWLR